MSCDDRIEVRIPGGDKAVLVHLAYQEGVALSVLLRRAFRIAMGQPVRLKGDDAVEVVALRKRINAIAARVDAISGATLDVRSIQGDLARAHADCQALLRR